MRVDLPAPFSPQSPWISPRLIRIETSDSAVTPGKVLVTWDMSRRTWSSTAVSCAWRIFREARARTAGRFPGPRKRAEAARPRGRATSAVMGRGKLSRLLRGRVLDVLVDALVGLEAGVDDQLLEVGLRDLEDLEELAGHRAGLGGVAGELGEGGGGEVGDLLALGELDGEVAGEGVSLRVSLRIVTVSSPRAMELQPASVASWPEMGVEPARPTVFIASRAPRAVPSLEATTASNFLPVAVRMFSMSFFALAGSQFSTHWSATTVICFLSMRGWRTSIWPLRKRWALLSVGLPPRRTNLPESLTARTPLAWLRPTSTLSKET